MNDVTSLLCLYVFVFYRHSVFSKKGTLKNGTSKLPYICYFSPRGPSIVLCWIARMIYCWLSRILQFYNFMRDKFVVFEKTSKFDAI